MPVKRLRFEPREDNFVADCDGVRYVVHRTTSGNWVGRAYEKGQLLWIDGHTYEDSLDAMESCETHRQIRSGVRRSGDSL